MGLSGEVAIAVAKKYTDTAIAGAGAIQGKNCTIQSITPITGGNRVTFAWYPDDSDTPETSTMDVMDGEGTSYYITPQDYGAVGDGVTDDTSAVNQAITSAMQGGGVVFFPAGEYLVDWGAILVSIPSDLVLCGEGIHKSIIHLDTEYVQSDDNGIVFSNGGALTTPNLTVKDLAVVYDDDDSSIILPDEERKVIQLHGLFGDVLFDNVYIHDGGSATLLPSHTLFWLQGGADTFIVRNCLFENFTNREAGGCLWITPLDSDAVTVRTINHVRVYNCEFRSTNKDEALGIWQRQNDTSFNCRDVVIDGNVFIHKDWNGTCFYNNNILTCYAKEGNVITVSYVITNNRFETHKMHGQPIKFGGLNGVVFADNEITVVDKTNDGSNIILTIEGGGKVTVRSNTWNYNSATFACEFKVVNNDVDFYDNVINSVCSVYFGNTTWTGTDVHTFNVVGNIIHISDPSYQLVIRKRATYGNMIFANNIINRGFAITGTPVGNGLEFRNNKFNNGGTRSTTDVKGSYFTFEDNSGILLSVDDTNITSKMTSFNYLGKASDLQFKEGGSVVADSTSVRDDFFTSCDIVYFGTSTI